MSPEAEKVWKAATDYLQMASDYLLPRLGRIDPITTEQQMSGQGELLLVWFLFPMLPEEYRDDLVQLRTEGWYFLTTRNYDQEAQSPESALDLEQREAEFEAIKEKILQVVLP